LNVYSNLLHEYRDIFAWTDTKVVLKLTFAYSCQRWKIYTRFSVPVAFFPVSCLCEILDVHFII